MNTDAIRYSLRELGVEPSSSVYVDLFNMFSIVLYDQNVNSSIIKHAEVLDNGHIKVKYNSYFTSYSLMDKEVLLREFADKLRLNGLIYDILFQQESSETNSEISILKISFTINTAVRVAYLI